MMIDITPETPDPLGPQGPSEPVEPGKEEKGRASQRGRIPSIPQNPLVQQLFRLGRRREDAEAKLEKRFAKKKKA
ncbi:hypothetical protein J2790_001790 [Paenarthrobacter nicotinovorans]|uniref:hypothetical protein n=1 Tax=Micrococcaceae TaxID=1268 RepID=UPI001113DA4E|nr:MULTISPECIES: hypothetical protein [Micrococcaceae]MDR6436669.1 hypothetical protein [Paenarthrobacter nicotinovorans]